MKRFLDQLTKLSFGLRLASFIGAAIVALLATMFRYELEVASNGSAYCLDRWTGDVEWIRGNRRGDVVYGAAPSVAP